MLLDNKDVEGIAHLARLAITSEKTVEYAENLSKILDFVEKMNSVNTDDVQPMAHPLEVCQRLRNDEILEKDQHDKFQSLAPKVEAQLYLVPQVIE